jgi:hypothetical protein
MHLQHQESIVTVERINIWNIETSRSTFATFAHNTWNMLLKHLKHVEHLLATCTELGIGGGGTFGARSARVAPGRCCCGAAVEDGDRGERLVGVALEDGEERLAGTRLGNGWN